MDMPYIEMLQGRRPAEIRIDNANIVDVYSGTIRKGCVCMGCGRILGFESLDAEVVFDAHGKFLLPGLIDSHVHIESSMLCPERFAELVLPCGTTTVIADPHEIANVKGLDGIRYMLDASEGIPLDVRIALSSCVPALPVEDSGAVLSAAELAELIDHPRVCGLAEMMNVPGVLNADADVMAKLDMALRAGKRIDGHAPMLYGRDLDMYAALGVDTDHECSTAKELEDRVMRGMYVLIREGSAARNLLQLLPAVTPSNQRRCLFCTDDRQSADILERGHINSHLRMAVASGMDAVSAIRIATLNAAECYNLRDKGGIAPGKCADVILADDLVDFRISAVWAKGELVAQDGNMLRPIPEKPASKVLSSVCLAPLPENPFAVHVPSGKARVLGMNAHSLLTDEKIMEVRTDGNGYAFCKDNPGMIKIAVLERHHRTGKMGVGLLDPIYGLEHGAIATTISHDSHNIVVAGDSEEDMLAAVRRVEAMGGGIAMVASGKVLEELPLPLGGLMSNGSGKEVADKLGKMLALAQGHYHIWEGADAFMTLGFMALTVIPTLKISARGLFNLEKFRFLDVDAEK